MTTVKNKLLFIGIIIFCIFALLFAYFTEYALKHKPCNLCLIERVPYMVTIILAFLVLIFSKYEKIILITIGLLFTIGTTVSFYHFGIEQGFFKESLVCELSIRDNDLSKETILNQLKELPVSCKDVTFKILGLSLVTYNIFFSLILCAINMKFFLTYENNK